MGEEIQESLLNQKNDMATCTNSTTQYADVGVPLRIKPYAVVGNIATECCGNPVVSLRSGSGTNCCCGCGCEITIMQTICIKIPVEYGATADVGETIVNCKRPNC